MSHERSPSVASDSTSSDSSFKAGDFISEERSRALSRTLESLGIELPCKSIRHGSTDPRYAMEDATTKCNRNQPAAPSPEASASASPSPEEAASAV